MTGGRCSRRRKVVDVGIDIPTDGNSEGGSLDLFTQARKALSDRSPFDLEDGQEVLTGNLPRELATVLCKRSDGRKRHKKSHSATGESKSQRLEKSRGAAFWAGKEVYFRGLTVADIDKLCELSTLDFTETSDCLLIPFVENDRTGTCSAVINGNVSASGNELGNVPEVQNKCDEQFMEVDSAGSVELNVEDKDSGFKQQTSGLEWLLGSRSKIYLTSERPSKKRKLLGGDAGLEKLIVSSAVEDSSSFCHYCGLDTVDQLNRLIVCSMCKMAVHQRCYGVQEEVSESWLCSWCMNRNQKGNSERPCLLCPKQGGALKPVLRSDSSGSMEFAHLFCCQWMPELYIEDTRKMEPIVNFEGIKETRHKLICRLCKIRCGACVRCSNGTCRASFHPICAREARQRMEIWGKFGSDDVELRAFCSKHSEDLNNISIVQGDQFPDQTIAKHQPVSSTMIKPHKLKISRRNGEVEGHFGTSELHLEKADCSVPHEGVLPDARSNLTNELECRGIQQSNTALVLDKSSEDVDTTESSNFKTILKKLIDQGKVSVNDVASDIGVSPEFLSSNLIGDNIVPELRSKIVEWMKNHAFIGPLQRNLKVRFKNLTKVEAVANGDTDGIVSDSCTPDVSVTSIPPRRRTKSDIRILKDGKALCVTRTSSIEDGTSMTHKSACHIIRDEPACQSEESVPDNSLKTLLEPAGSRDILQSNSSKIEGSKLSYCTASDSVRAVEGAIPEKNAALDSVSANPVYDTAVNCVPDLINEQSVCSFHMHPTIRKTLSEMPNPAVIRFLTDDNDGLRDRELSPLEASSSSSICCNHQSDKLASPGSVYKFRPGLEQLAKAGRMGILEHSPADEVEGELIFYQQQLLHNALAKKRFSDNLMSKILTNLPEEIDALGKQKWDAVTANKFLYELKEVKKQGRKERRHKEAQAVLAAATAAAAASSRISSFRKDSREESAHQDINPLKADFYSGGAGLYSQQMPRAKETLSRLGTTRVSSEKNYDAVYTNSDFSKDHPRTCEICRRSETILNPILICTSCKVAVHLDCYRCVKDSGGPWYCELCEELSSRSCGALAVNSWEKPYFLAECGFCNGTAGAFRKSTDGQWIHAFCAEWVLESTYKRGQANPVKGMETVIKGSEMCHICRRKQGVCIKCNYGHCQNSFHPSCARSAGFQMNLKTVGSKLQHKAYCEKHSLVERAKAETQKHGMEELKILKPVRVELEKLRLLCERIIRREKLKRDLVLCSHEVLDSNREAASLSALACVSFYQTDVSSESATTLLKSYTDGCKSGNEAIQKSDDITVDSTVAGKSRTKFHVPVDNDQKTDDSSTSQQPCPSKPSDGASFSGKQIPSRPSVPSWSFPSDVENCANYRKYTETFEKELVMTSDQASMKNQRLPKGLVYVPIHCLSGEKEAVPDACSTQEQLKSDE
ncbi:hypothetical protein DCAR_0519978 [Daucus carota subsp. sativus]|uniref:PHD-type domain-containing protein n=1 Tax=Daucus carota subsp. sativus TaxID=79200 RepID=A0AAF0X3R2_DAUCS|nr:hypothetical protein DCAR_0519978 [Daucus carota subsp. sativus]